MDETQTQSQTQRLNITKTDFKSVRKTIAVKRIPDSEQIEPTVAKPLRRNSRPADGGYGRAEQIQDNLGSFFITQKGIADAIPFCVLQNQCLRTNQGEAF